MSNTLTVEQSRVATWLAGPLLVLAVAGSGKTFTMIRLVLHWLVSGVLPGDIMVCTFSTRAAADFRRRAAESGIPANVDIRTLNSLGWTIIGEITELPSKQKPRRDPVLVDARGPNGWWIKKLVREQIKGWSTRVRDPKLLPKVGRVLSEISHAKSHLIWPEGWTDADGNDYQEYHEWATTREREPVSAIEADIVDDCYKTLEAVAQRPEDHGFESPKDRHLPRALRGRRREQRAPRQHVRWFSFDDQIALPAKWIRQNDGKRFRFMDEFKGVFGRLVVDEAQDDNPAQDTLARWIAEDAGNGPNLVLVGDDQQSIYTFRGARPDLLREFRDSAFGTTVLQLSKNFRCAQLILDVGNGILDHAEDRLFEGNLQLGRRDRGAEGGTVTATEYDSIDQEAAGVADTIQEAIAYGVNPDECAVLFRLNSQTGPVELELIKRGIRYRVAGSSFFNRPEIKALIAYLALALDENDNDAFKRAARSPNRFLGAKFFKAHETFKSAREAYEYNKRGLWRGWRDGLSELIPHVDKVRELLLGGEDALKAAIEYISEDVGVRVFFRDEAASDEDETDVDVSLQALAACAESVGSAETLVEFARDDSGATHSDYSGERTAEPRVTLSTVHKSKGMEWEFVAAPGWTKGTFPFYRSLEEEERRLGYVCATRARQYLHVSWSAIDARGEFAGPSSLVGESGVEEVAALCGEPTWPLLDDDEDTPSTIDLSWGTPIGG